MLMRTALGEYLKIHIKMHVPENVIRMGVGIGGSALLGYLAWRKIRATYYCPNIWEEVGEVSGLYIFPVKSARGIAVKEGFADIYGLKSDLLEDRSFVVIDENGTFVSSRTEGLLAIIKTEWNNPTLTLTAKGYQDISIDTEQCLQNNNVIDMNMRGAELRGIDCGDEVSEWLSQVLSDGKKKYKLLYRGQVLQQRPARRPEYYTFKLYNKSDTMYYQDTCSYMLGSESSLDDLNSRLDEPVTNEQFRANIMIKGAPAYDEDDWLYVRIGQVVLRWLKPCDRCILTIVDPETGKRHPDHEPLKTLRTYRLLKDPPELAKAWSVKPIWGVHYGIDTAGKIGVGDKVFVARASTHPHLSGY